MLLLVSCSKTGSSKDSSKGGSGKEEQIIQDFLSQNKHKFNLSSMKYFSFLASFGKLAYLDLSNKPL